MHPIENIMQTAMAEIKEMVDVNTIVGDPIISTDGSTIIPVSKVCFGFISGGGEYGDSEGEEAKFPFAGGASSGISITPIGFLVVDETNVQLLSVSGKSMLEKVIETLPQVIFEIKEAMKDNESEEE
ncbi:MAG: GerW family sporulation protein [Eubacteriales bacterium]|nr:GerW family sporulation protein [Eubacteriales bacterium]